MRQKKTIEQWIDTLPPAARQLKIELGARGSATRVGLIGIEEGSPIDCDGLGAHVRSLAESAGWGAGEGEETRLRIYALDSGSKILSSYTNTLKTEVKAPISDIAALTKEHRAMLDKVLDTVVEQARIQTRTIDVLTETIAHREAVSAAALEAMVEAQGESAESNAMNMLLENALENHEAASNPYQATAGKALEAIIASLTGGGPPEEEHLAPSEEQVAEWYANDLFFQGAVKKLVAGEAQPETD